MFEQVFKEELQYFAFNKPLIPKLWTEIKTCYSSPGRHYHNLAHLDNMIGQLFPVKSHLEDWLVIILSIAYHDIIYNTIRQDNEEQSAALARKRLLQLGLSTSRVEKSATQILATKGHRLAIDDDTNYFIDADLSILGADMHSYTRYTEQIRKEYRCYPDFLYNPGRKKVLTRFLEMKQIFKTLYFREKYEEQARINISHELKTL